MRPGAYDGRAGVLADGHGRDLLDRSAGRSAALDGGRRRTGVGPAVDRQGRLRAARQHDGHQLLGPDRVGAPVVHPARAEHRVLQGADEVLIRALDGVAMVTAGPGVTNTVTAMANASLARAPVLLIGGCTSRPQANMGPLQDIPHVDILRPVTRGVLAYLARTGAGCARTRRSSGSRNGRRRRARSCVC